MIIQALERDEGSCRELDSGCIVMVSKTSHHVDVYICTRTYDIMIVSLIHVERILTSI